MLSVPVPPWGPLDAPLMVIGEAGGKNEGLQGRPFVGMVGDKMRRMIASAGLDPDTQVLWANAIGMSMGSLPKTVAGMKAVVDAHRADLDNLFIAARPKAILLLGRAALYRMTGQTGITVEHGGVFQTTTYNVPTVVCLHPAAVMRSKLAPKWTLVAKAVQRAVDYARGAAFDPYAQYPAHNLVLDGDSLGAVLQGARTVAIDTEFDRNTQRPFLVGITRDGLRVLSVRPNASTIPVLRHLLLDPTVEKVFHNAPADVSSLGVLGLNVVGPVHDTMLAQATLFPDLSGHYSLAQTALFWLDHWRNWKWMDHTDTLYNAIDVVATWRCWQLQRVALIESMLYDVYEREVMTAAALCFGLEMRGMRVSSAEQGRLRGKYKRDTAERHARIEEFADNLFRKRSEPLIERLDEIAAEIEVLEECGAQALCGTHPEYTGLRKPTTKIAKAGECGCNYVYEQTKSVRDRIKALRTERTSCDAKVKRWAQGFSATNNDHVRWLLYDKDALHLPKQHKDGKLTANADAIARLLTNAKVNKDAQVVDLLRNIKAIQHNEKMVSTFVDVMVDEDGYAHPGIRVYGAGTGRPAGGSDDAGADKKQNEFAYNAMNIPEEARSIYLPNEQSGTAPWVPVEEESDNDSDDEEDEALAEGEAAGGGA